MKTENELLPNNDKNMFIDHLSLPANSPGHALNVNLIIILCNFLSRARKQKCFNK